MSPQPTHLCSALLVCALMFNPNVVLAQDAPPVTWAADYPSALIMAVRDDKPVFVYVYDSV